MPRPDLVLRPGRDGTRLVPDVAYPRAFTLRVDRTDQSYVDLDDPLRLEFDYQQQITVVLDQLAPPGVPLRTVHVGGAAMTLARYIAATRPRSAQVVLEPDAELTAFVRQHLPLPVRSGIRVRGIDEQLQASCAEGRVRQRMVVLDAFVGPRTPAALTSLEYWTDIGVVDAAVGGTVVINITDHRPIAFARRVLASLAACLPRRLDLAAEASTLKGRNSGTWWRPPRRVSCSSLRSPPRPVGAPLPAPGWAAPAPALAQLFPRQRPSPTPRPRSHPFHPTA